MYVLLILNDLTYSQQRIGHLSTPGTSRTAIIHIKSILNQNLAKLQDSSPNKKIQSTSAILLWTKSEIDLWTRKDVMGDQVFVRFHYKTDIRWIAYIVVVQKYIGKQDQIIPKHEMYIMQ